MATSNRSLAFSTTVTSGIDLPPGLEQAARLPVVEEAGAGLVVGDVDGNVERVLAAAKVPAGTRLVRFKMREASDVLFSSNTTISKARHCRATKSLSKDAQ